MVLFGVLAGPYGLNLLTPAVLQVVDPIVAMALAMLGAIVGLATDPRGPRIDTTLGVVAAGGVALVALREPSLLFVPTAFAFVGISIIIAFAVWLLVGQTDSEREQRVFAVGSLLLLGGAAAYLSLSALFAGLVAGIVWNATGGLARARITRDLAYLQHPLIVLVLLVAGASLTASVEALAVAGIVLGLQYVLRFSQDASPLSAALIAIALAVDVVRGSLR